MRSYSQRDFKNRWRLFCEKKPLKYWVRKFHKLLFKRFNHHINFYRVLFPFMQQTPDPTSNNGWTPSNSSIISTSPPCQNIGPKRDFMTHLSMSDIDTPSTSHWDYKHNDTVPVVIINLSIALKYFLDWGYRTHDIWLNNQIHWQAMALSNFAFL